MNEGEGPNSLNQSQDERELSDLMKKAQKGEGQAYNQLLTRIERMLQSFVRKSVSTDSCDDVIQEIILAVHAKRHTFNSEQFFLPWFYAIARYKVIDWIRAKGKRELLTFEPEDFEQLAVAEIVDLDAVTVDDLDGILKHLPEKQQEVVRMVKIQGLSVKDTAEKLNLSESDVKVTVHRAIKALRAKFEGGSR